MAILTQNIVKEKIENKMIKRILGRVRTWLFYDKLDVARMKEGFYRAFR